MLDTFTLYEELSASLGDGPARAVTKALAKIHDDLANSVTKAEFNELKAVVADLAIAQQNTEKRLETLAMRMDELAEAQKRTEARVEELAEAQKRTEARLEALATRVDELAEAQKRTEESLNKLITRVDAIEVQLGGLSMAVGYGIEDKLYPYIAAFLKKVFHVEPAEIILRKHIEYADGRFDEINIYAEAIKNGKEILIVGECKAQPGKKDVDRFVKTSVRVKEHSGKEVLKYLVGYTFAPDVEKYIRAHYPDVRYYKTYQIEHGKY